MAVFPTLSRGAALLFTSSACTRSYAKRPIDFHSIAASSAAEKKRADGSDRPARMNRTRLRVLTIPKEPFVIARGDGVYEGMLVDLLEEIAHRLNFTYEISEQPDGLYGQMDDEGNWNGLMLELQKGRADVGLGGISFMRERQSAVDFTEPIYKKAGYSVLMLKPEIQTSTFRFLNVLEVDVWLSIVAAYLLTSALLWIFDTFSPYSYRNRKNRREDDPEKRIFTIKESLWFSLTSLTPQGGGIAPKNLSGRLVAATWWLFGFIIIASYTANLAAFLTIRKFEKTIETFDELISQYKYQYGIIGNSSTEKYFERMQAIEYRIWKDMSLNDSLSSQERSKLAVWEYPLSDKYIKIYSALSAVRRMKNLKEALKHFDNNPKYSLITEATDVQYITMTNCSFKEIGPEFSKKTYAIALRKNSTLKKQFDSVIFELKANNRFYMITDKWWKNNPKRQTCTNDYDEATTGMLLGNLSGLFFLVAFGIALAFVTLIYEFFYFKFMKERLDRRYDRQIAKIKSIVSLKMKFNRIRIKI